MHTIPSYVESLRHFGVRALDSLEGTVGGVGPAGGNTDLVSVLRTARQDEGLSDRVAHVDFDKLEGLHAQPLFRRSG